MTYFRTVVFVAAIAGLLAGVVLAGLQSLVTVPLILQAETFEGEGAPMQHSGMQMSEPVDAQSSGEAADGAVEEQEPWAPADGVERFMYTLGANLVGAIGFALLLVTVSEFAGGILNWREGLFWGLAGFAAFTLAPSLGLPPNMPSMPAADIIPRQAWWISTAVATSAGLALLIFRRSFPLAALGLLLILAPHVIGAPQPDSYETAVPEGLHQQFIVSVTVISLVFWAVMGVTVGVVRSRFAEPAESAARRFA